jgi:hypothetical protein
VAGREGGRLVQEEELGELPGLHQRLPVPSFELESAGDPAAGGEAAPDLAAVVVQAASVPVDESAGGIRDQLARAA